MRKFPWLLVLGAGVVGWYIMSRKSVAKSIKGVLRKVSLGGNVLKPKIYLTFGIQNASSSSATLKSLVGSIYSNNKLIADISNFSTTKIKPNSETTFKVVAEPQWVGVASQILDYIKTRDRKINFSFEGNINVDGNAIPIKTTYSL